MILSQINENSNNSTIITSQTYPEQSSITKNILLPSLYSTVDELTRYMTSNLYIMIEFGKNIFSKKNIFTYWVISYKDYCKYNSAKLRLLINKNENEDIHSYDKAIYLQNITWQQDYIASQQISNDRLIYNDLLIVCQPRQYIFNTISLIMDKDTSYHSLLHEIVDNNYSYTQKYPKNTNHYEQQQNDKNQIQKQLISCPLPPIMLSPLFSSYKHHFTSVLQHNRKTFV